jgi:PAS domain S-box-containing protein
LEAASVSKHQGSAWVATGAPPADALSVTEEQFRVFFQLSGAGMAQVDLRSGHLLYVNDALCALTGYSAHELLGMSFLDITHPDDRAADLARFTAMVRGETPTYVSDKRYVRKDGHIIWALVTASLVRDASGQPLRSLAVIQDVSERRRAEEALRESEARVRGLLDATQDGILGLDLEGRCTFANASGVRLLGFESADGLLGQKLHALMHHSRPDGCPYPEHECPIHGALHTAASADEDGEVFFRRDGSSFPVLYRVSPLRREGGTVGAVVTFNDVTERRRVEEERARTLTLLDTLAHNAAEALYLMDAEGRTTYMNPAAERMFGWSRQDAEGRVLHELIHHTRPDGSPFPMEACPLGAVMSTGTPALGHTDVFVHKDGRHLPVSCSNAAVVTDGRITGAVLVVHDLTERQRTQEQARQRLEFEQQLIGIVSHDLRSPVTAMLLGAQALMRREDVSAPVLKSLARIESSGQRATRLIRDLLDFTQARLGGGIPIHRRPMDLHDVLRQLVEEVGPAHPERELLLEVDGDGRGAWDGDRLAQITTNLLSNAVTYSPEGAVVRVRAWGEPDAVTFSVHNPGPAIPPDVLPHLFDPFRRGRHTSQGNTGSVGLGLFIVDQLVSAHAGAIQVGSLEGEGTTFTVRLPRQPSA